MTYSCRPCAVEWDADQEGEYCWHSGKPGRIGEYRDGAGHTVPWTSREIVHVRESA